MAVWAIGCFEEDDSKILFKKIVQMLDDRFLQVRTSACVALGVINPSKLTSVLPKLLKSLKDGSINRDVVCETIMLSQNGPFELIDISEKYHSDPLVLRACLRALKKVDGNISLVDPIASHLLKFQRYI